VVSEARMVWKGFQNTFLGWLRNHFQRLTGLAFQKGAGSSATRGRRGTVLRVLTPPGRRLQDGTAGTHTNRPEHSRRSIHTCAMIGLPRSISLNHPASTCR
jgi:hypothetical protein